jgi:hypothetical protein
LGDILGRKLEAKLRRAGEDNLKRKLKEAQSDPKVQKASKLYGAD